MRVGLFSSKRQFLVLAALIITSLAASGAPALDTSNPLGFFTNVASRLLASPLNVNLAHIQIYPTNQYTPAVHRLLQVAANVYDATTTNRYPSVFRPLFSRDAGGLGTNLFISGYTNVLAVNPVTDDRQLGLPMDAGDLAATNVPVVNLPVNVYGVPWIIGAKKGLPNFNALALDTAFQLTRKLMVTRASPIASVNTYTNYQMFILSLTNQVGVECWNSYTNTYTNEVTIYVYDYLKNVALTNDEGFSTNLGLIFPVAQSVAVWQGYNPVYPLLSFQLPLNISFTTISNSIYRFNPGGTPYLTGDLYEKFETNVTGYPQPHWGLMLTNRLRVIMLDTSSGTPPYPVIDYVQLDGPNGIRDLTSEIMTNYDAGTGGNDLWDTNIQASAMPVGLANQIMVSLGLYNPSVASGVWSQTDPTLREIGIDAFRSFFHLAPLYSNVPGDAAAIAAAQATNSIQAPFIAIATVAQHISWQANDPLVHYLASDLNWAGASRFDRYSVPLTNENLGVLNQRYAPWGHGPLLGGGNPVDQNPSNRAYKDPLVRKSDDWNFPTGAPLNAGWLGQVHRGTPWQTIYLKATNILALAQSSPTFANGPWTWMYWTGDLNPNDAAATAPVQDWHVASLLVSLLNTNDFCSLVSVNDADSNAWLGLLDGLTVLTNDLTDAQINNLIVFGGSAQFDSLLVSSNSDQAAFITAAVQAARASQPNGVFRDIGDVLATPQLTDQSPFLNWNDSAQQGAGISDEAYEAIPSQLLARLRADSFGSIAPAYGQAQVQFTGYDGHTYAVEVSPDLKHWTCLGTYSPVNGVFSLMISVPPGAGPQFYRSVLRQ